VFLLEAQKQSSVAILHPLQKNAPSCITARRCMLFVQERHKCAWCASSAAIMSLQKTYKIN
jgi:hypothetical protein